MYMNNIIIICRFCRHVYDPFGCILQRTRTSIVAQLHVKVQSNRRRSPTPALPTGMSERLAVGRSAQKVNIITIFLLLFFFLLENLYKLFFYFVS